MSTCLDGLCEQISMLNDRCTFTLGETFDCTFPLRSKGQGTAINGQEIDFWELELLTGANWHWLRHAHATMLDAAGTPLGTVRALLGHSSSELMRGTYIHSVPADVRKAVEDVENLLGPKPTQVLISSSLIH